MADAKSKTSVTVAILRIPPCAFVFFMVMGLIMFGAATPTEAAATGVFGAIIVAFIYGKIYGKFLLRMIAEALTTAATVSALLLVIMCCAVMFSQLLTFTGETRAVAELVAHRESGRYWQI